MIKIYTDGACKGNQSIKNMGGWGYVLTNTETDKMRHCCGHEPNTTNNRMEMMAAIKALEAFRKPMTAITLYSDSKYVTQGMTEWILNWKANGWKNAKKKPIENQDLWKRLDKASSMHKVTWCHVKGHNGNAGNELADKLANCGTEGQRWHKDFISTVLAS